MDTSNLVTYDPYVQTLSNEGHQSNANDTGNEEDFAISTVLVSLFSSDTVNKTSNSSLDTPAGRVTLHKAQDSESGEYTLEDLSVAKPQNTTTMVSERLKLSLIF